MAYLRNRSARVVVDVQDPLTRDGGGENKTTFQQGNNLQPLIAQWRARASEWVELPENEKTMA